MSQREGEGHVIANMVLLMLCATMGLLMCASTVLNLVTAAADDLRGQGSAAYQQGYALGQTFGFLYTTTGALTLTFGGPACFIGLLQREPWGLRLTRAFWVATLVLCCCIPFAAYGLWSLSRPSVLRLFGLASRSEDFA